MLFATLVVLQYVFNWIILMWCCISYLFPGVSYLLFSLGWFKTVCIISICYPCNTELNPNVSLSPQSKLLKHFFAFNCIVGRGKTLDHSLLSSVLLHATCFRAWRCSYSCRLVSLSPLLSTFRPVPGSWPSSLFIARRVHRPFYLFPSPLECIVNFPHQEFKNEWILPSVSNG